MDLDWQLPIDGDLYGRARQIGKTLYDFYGEYYTEEQVRAAFPDIANAATYALYRVLSEDIERVGQWREIYLTLFSSDPSIPSRDTFASMAQISQVAPTLRRPFNQPVGAFYAVNSFFDHSFPLYSQEGDVNASTLSRFDGTVFEVNSSLADCTLGVNCYSGHPALDFGLPPGANVLAANSGRLILCNEQYGALFIEHYDGLVTSYLHMDPLQIPDNIACLQVREEKPSVVRGQTIGYASNKGTSGVHLHFGVGYEPAIAERKNIDPFGWWDVAVDPWSRQEVDLESAWLWRGDEAGDGFLTVDNRETQAQLFRHPGSGGDWNRVDDGYQGEAWYAILNLETDPPRQLFHWAIWGTYITDPGLYEVQAYWPADPSDDSGEPTSAAEYRIYRYVNGELVVSEVIADQVAQADQWVSLGTYNFGNGATVVMLSDVTHLESENGKRVYFDAVRWKPAPPTPTPSPTSTRTPTPTSTPTVTPSMGYYLTGPYNLTITTIAGSQYAYGVNAVQQPAGSTFAGMAIFTDYVRTGFKDAQDLGYSPRLHGNSSPWDFGANWYCRTHFNGPEHPACVFAASQLGVTFASPRPTSYWTDIGAPGSTIFSAFTIESLPCCSWPSVTGHLTVYYIWSGLHVPTPTPIGTPAATPTTYVTPSPSPTPTSCGCPAECLAKWLFGLASTGPSVRPPGLTALLQSYASLLSDPVEILGLLRNLRDQVMTQTPEGQRLITLYDEFSFDLTEAILSDEALSNEAWDVIELFVPNVLSLVEGQGDETTISQEQVAALETFLDHVSSLASTELKIAIARERALRPLQAMVGLNMDQAWDRVNGYNLEWLPPLDQPEPLHVERGDTLSVAFYLSDYSGDPVFDSTVAFYLLDIVGTPLLGPIGLSANPGEGLLYEGAGRYRYNLSTSELLEAPYRIVVAFNSLSGVWQSVGIWVEEPSEGVRVQDFVLLGQEGVHVEQNGQILSGHVGANTASGGPYLAKSSEVTIGISADVLDPDSLVLGDSIYLKQNSTIYDVYYNELDGLGQVLGQQFTPVSLPLVSAFPDLPVFSPGTQDIDVPQDGSLSLEAGAYGLLKARRGSTVSFVGGIYDFSEWDVGENVQIYFQAHSQIRIAGKLAIDQGSYLGPEPSSSGINASDIVIYVNGINGNSGNLSATPKAAKFGINTVIHANVYAPNGTLWLRQNGQFTGAFLARWVDLGIGATAQLQSQWQEGTGN